MKSLKTLATACILLLSTTAFAQVNKCKVDGKVVYQAEPCKAGGERVNLYGAGQAAPNLPPSNPYKKEGATINREKQDSAVKKMADDDIQRSIANKQVIPGMTTADVIGSWGKPTHISQTHTGNQPSEQWVYEGKNVVLSRYVNLTNGVVTSVQSPR